MDGMEEGAETDDSSKAEDTHTTRAGLPLALPIFARNQEYGVGVPERSLAEPKAER